LALETTYQWLIQLGQIIAVVAAIVVATYKITSAYHNLRERVKVLEKADEYYKEQLDRQRQEISDITKLFRDIGIKIIIEKSSEGDKNG
jgi:hypothetical protein